MINVIVFWNNKSLFYKTAHVTNDTCHFWQFSNDLNTTSSFTRSSIFGYFCQIKILNKLYFFLLLVLNKNNGSKTIIEKVMLLSLKLKVNDRII